MLHEDEFHIILAIERAADHHAVLLSLNRLAELGPVCCPKSRERLVEALHWARKRVRANDRQQVLRSTVAVRLSRELLETLGARHPSEAALETARRGRRPL